MLANMAERPINRSAAPSPEEITKAASQFEAVLVRQLLAPAIEPLFSGEGVSGGGVYGYMLTDTLATAITNGGGLGFSGLVRHQLAPPTAPAETPLSQPDDIF